MNIISGNAQLHVICMCSNGCALNITVTSNLRVAVRRFMVIYNFKPHFWSRQMVFVELFVFTVEGFCHSIVGQVLT